MTYPTPPASGWPAILTPDRDLDELRSLAGRRLRNRGLASPRLDRQSLRELDPRPRLLEAGEWAKLERLVTQRMRALNALADDLDGDHTVVRDGVVPPHAVYGNPAFTLAAQGWSPPHGRRIVLAAFDVRRNGDGRWEVLAHHVGSPSELGRALENREIMTQLLPAEFQHHGVRRLGYFQARLRRCLATLAPLAPESGRVLLLSPGRSHPGHPDLAELARVLGYTLAEAGDLTVRHGHLFLSSLAGLEPVHVLLRHGGDRGIDPLELAGDDSAGIAGLVGAVRRGHVAVANAIGTGVLDSTELAPWWPAITRHLLGEEAPSEVAGEAPQGGHGEQDGELIRVYATTDGSDVTVMPGGFVTGGGAGISADLWVRRGVEDTTIELPVRVADQHQVDFMASLPSRAGEAMYLLGRHLERAEAIIRLTRTVLDHAERAPLTAPSPATVRLATTLGALTGRVGTADAVLDTIETALGDAANPSALPATVSQLLADAAAVRELLATEVWDGLGRLRETLQRVIGHHDRRDLGWTRDQLDRMLGDLASVAGVVHESMLHGPGWALLDGGRRLERAQRQLELLERLHRPNMANLDEPSGGGRSAHAEDELLEALLSTAVSLVAYRRRHRSDLDADAVFALLLTDASNPRSVRFGLSRLVEDLALLPEPVRPGGRASTAGRAEELVHLAATLGPDSLTDPTGGAWQMLTGGILELGRALQDSYLRHNITARLAGPAPAAVPPGGRAQ